MRVHSLEIQAFGPFPGHEVLDFEPLYEAGLFLLTGNTGAGKTSVLDAICFGLFGSVPGARGSAKELKSHHAAQSAEPTISLDVTIKSRRFRVRRSPAWQRPSSRSKQGYVVVNAKATLEELVEGRWTASSSRLDEIGQQISAVLGMNRDQFCQVVMLPQGQFHTFLRAGAKERHDVLESLFETSRFQRIEKWLTQQRLLRDQDCQAHQTKLVEVLARAHEVAASLPCGIDTISNDTAVGHKTLASGPTFVDFTAASGGLRDLAESAISAEASALLREQLAGAHLKAQQHLLDEARALLERQSRFAEATQRREALEATREEMEQRERQLERARAADACAPLLRLVRQTDVDLARANDGVSRAQCACAAFASHPEGLLAVDDVALNVEQLHVEAAQSLALLPMENDVRQNLGEAGSIETRLAELTRDCAAGRAALDEVPPALAELMEEEAATALLAQTAEPAQRRVDAAKRIVQAADSAFDLLPRLEKLTAELVAAQRRRLELRENWLDLRERRLAGIAAELAHQLSDGGNCPVCGSTTHPSPAKAGTDPVDRVTEGMALELSQQAEERIAALEAERGALTTNKAAADASTGGLSIPQAVALLGEATADAEAATDAATRLDDLQTSCLQMQERAGALVAHITGLDKQVSRLQATLDSLSRQTQRGQAQLAHHRGEWPSMSAKFEALQHELTSSSLLLEALKSRQSLEQSLLEQHRGLTEELRASGFSDLSELEAAILSAPQRANVEALNRSYCDELAATLRTLADPVLREAGVSATPDLDALVETVEVAASEHLEVAHVAGQLSRCQQRLSQLADDFALALDELTPLLQARDVATELASMCAGTAVGNSSKTKLSHYVLGARLQQVVSAANLRLAGVCGGRYQLLHSMVRSVGDARGGLGLMVLDTYTGQERDPATLSGGETFYVSLALALGLADLVRDEVGGAELSTLFVDEGFGSLDPETLDDVMDEIDSLRSGGRCVGLVSHLADLKLRVPTQVELLRSPAGSHIQAS